MAYRIQENSQGRKYVKVGQYIIWLYADRLEVALADEVIEIIDYMVIEPTQAEKVYLLKELIHRYHTGERLPF